ncbi:IclR family transcriptional regulator [Roseinatronobacter sp. S2]|uniref:IclR family transcriptional regulator n=1 Tax=Roseinatronobacter sp. S2 TaxID=3035471 RepID=UPI002410150A|nr:IclR family transcriptional regulator [Roseinatronobacter sp. S2]WFE76656.1 IclR family transcriptional regulator [Roseinatronobacter sp. S2]
MFLNELFCSNIQNNNRIDDAKLNVAKAGEMDTTLLKGLNILEVIVAGGEPASVSELARKLDLPKSNVHRTVASLREADYLRFDPDSRRYFPSLKLAQMGTRVAASFPFRMAVLPFLQALVRETSESAHFALLDGSSVVFLANALPSVAVASVIPDNLALRWDDSALGIALVSALAEDARAALLASSGASDKTVQQVARASIDGYALIRRHETRRIFELAAPVLSEWNTVIGAIGITGPAMRFSEDRLPNQLEATLAAAASVFHQDAVEFTKVSQTNTERT